MRIAALSALTRNAKFRSIAFQCALVAIVLLACYWLIQNMLGNLAARGIAVGWDFLERAARFPISQSVLPYSPTDTFAWAFVVGLGNTIFVSTLIVVSASVLGLVVALTRRSHNPLVDWLGSTFVEITRNTPLVVQLLFWYSLLTIGLPHPHEALNPLRGVYLTDRGLYLPAPHFENFSFVLEYPELGRFNFVGGLNITPEFAAMFTGLVLYSAAFIGEIIRGGIDAIAKGQWEAGRALSESQTLRRIVMPQALRVIIPPLTSQYINIVKNTTLALVVGYPELAFVTATAINQTGQAVEGVLILILIYLSISLGASALLNWYNCRIAFVQR